MTHPAVEQRGNQLFLKVRVVPGSSRDKFGDLHGDAIKINVSAPPEKGKANSAVGKLIANTLNLRPSQVTLSSGETSREKSFLIEGIELEELVARLPG